MVQQFFARIYSFWTFEDDAEGGDWEDDPESVTDANFSEGYYDRAGTAEVDRRTVNDGFGVIPNDGTPTPPVVTSVSSVCANNNCVEGVPGAFSVNGSEGRVYNAQSSFLANVEFFGYPDQNQFPIRNVIVDWGDGVDVSWANGMPGVTNVQQQVWGRGSESGSTTDDNYYKARRGLNAQQEQICSPPAEDVEWGLTPDSCQDGPFQFQHHYRCTPGMLAWLNAANRQCERVPGTNNLVNSPCVEPGGGACVFQPRVYVEDNWGYCTGTCVGGSDGGSACFGELFSPPTTVDDQCNFELYPIIYDPGLGNDPNNSPAEDAREDAAIEPYWNPWVNWDGTIVVEPS